MSRSSLARWRWSTAVVALALAAMACGRAAQQAATVGPARQAGALRHGGLVRSYLIQTPQAAEAGAAMPLVLVLHGGGGDAQRACELAGGVGELIEEAGFIMVCPRGVEGHWNDGRAIDDYRAHREGIDDVGFLLAVIEDVAKHHAVDRSAVFVTGVSNGGMMTYRMACEAAGTFAAAAALIANLPADLDCAPAKPIPVLIMNGTEDPMMPYEGGEVRFLNRRLGRVHSTAATVEHWRNANGCDAGARIEERLDDDPDDGTALRRVEFTSCDGRGRLVLYEVQGGGHTIPGGDDYAPEGLIGPVSREAHAGDLVWRFFASTSAGS